MIQKYALVFILLLLAYCHLQYKLCGFISTTTTTTTTTIIIGNIHELSGSPAHCAHEGEHYHWCTTTTVGYYTTILLFCPTVTHNDGCDSPDPLRHRAGGQGVS